MHQIIIDEISCGVCGAPKGQPCDHGDRLDDFRGKGSPSSRLLVHVDTLRSIYDHNRNMYDECTETSCSLTDMETEAWNQGKDEALSMMFDAVDEWCSSGRFDLVDEFLSCLVVDKMNPTMMVGAMSITSRARLHLQAREAFVRAVRERLTETETSERVESLMKGLE